MIYRFYSFSDRDFTFKYIRRLWANASTHAGSDDESSQASEEEKVTNKDANKKLLTEKSII